MLSEDYSGSVQGITDATGKAANLHTSGESEVLSVTIGGQRIQFCPDGLGSFSPSLTAGLKVVVQLTSE